MANYVPASSTLVKGVEYSYKNETMDVAFLSGLKVRYYGVPSTMWRSLRQAPSAGSYIARHIVRGPYRQRKLVKI